MYGAIILAAGNGNRMCSDLPKVLHALAGVPILLRIIKSALDITDLQQVIIVGGANIELLKATCSNLLHTQEIGIERICWAHQSSPQGTADAVATGLSKVNKAITNIIVISGDLPLITTGTLKKLKNSTLPHAIGIATHYVNSPYGFGRIKRDQDNNFVKIIEESDATLEEKQITEVNVGLYSFPREFLMRTLPNISNHNAQKEYYLTDLLAHAITQKIAVNTITPDNPLEGISINTRAQLIELERSYQLQQALGFIDKGVTIIDPKRFDVRGGEISISKDVEIDINVVLVGNVLVEQGAKIGANCYIKDTIIRSNVVIQPNSVIEGAIIEDNAIVGPFARIRANTRISCNAKVGNFVEIKSSFIGEYTKINHLSYVGDAQIGSYVNIGAGTITCNYDGANKHVTTIKDHVSVGAGCQLIAPVILEKEATLAAGTTLIHNAPAGKLTLNKKVQHSLKWQRPVKTKKITEKLDS